jgi:phosphomannomutase/phosphoglucomutase
LEVVSAITQAFADHECSVVDGVRVRFDNEDGEYVGWYLARKSNTEPVLVMRMEATTDDQLNRMKAMADERVSGVINIEKLLNA